MVTFGLLGTAPSAEHKVAFDPDRKKRRAMYREVCEIFKDFSVYIGGSTSFDFAGKKYNKYDATLDWARDHGYENELTKKAGIEMDPKTRGPKVDPATMATSVPGVFAGGNVVRVYDLVDWVSRDSATAGRSAAEYARSLKG